MTDLVAFIRARLDEDQRTADGLSFACRIPNKMPDFTSAGGPAAEEFWESFGPARVLREVEALRAIVALVLDYENEIDQEWGTGDSPAESRTEEIPALRALAAIWRDHPDYDPSWGQ